MTAQDPRPPLATLDPKVQVAVRAVELRHLFLTLQVVHDLARDPAIPLLQPYLDLTAAPGARDHPIALLHPDDLAQRFPPHHPTREPIRFSARRVLQAMASDDVSDELIGEDLASIAMMHAAIRLGDLLDRHHLYRANVPVLQFARHFRNACAHGDRWYFEKGQPHPKQPAQCRHLVITAALQGQRATFETVTPRLFVEFLGDVANHFVPGIAPPPNPYHP